MNQNLKILLLEDSKDDAALIENAMKKGGLMFTSFVVDTQLDYENALRDINPDVIISDHSLPAFNSREAIKIYKKNLQEHQKVAPFILVAGTISEEFAVQCIKEGADDYILKDRLQRLPSAIISALEKCRIENEHRKVVGEKLQLLERYEYVTQATSEAIWDWDIVNNFVYCGKGFETIFGYTNDLLQNSFNLNTAYICVDDIERVVTGIDEVIAGTEKNWSDEYRYLKADGEYAFVLDKAIVIRDENGKAVRMVGAMRDITSKKKENLRLKLLESVITNTTDAVLIAEVEASGITGLRIVYVNEAFTKMTGYEDFEVIGKTPLILQGEKSNQLSIERLRKAIEDKIPCQSEMISYKKGGQEFCLNFSVAPVADENGCVTHWVFIERDVTEQRSRTKAIEDQNLQLKEIAWIQSHVVRAPLARLMGFINIINQNKDNADDRSNLLQYVLDAANEVDVIIREIVEKTENVVIENYEFKNTNS